jgi:hypothetical protein
MNHGQTRTYKTHHGPNLGEATTFPLIIYFMLGHKISTQMSFYPWESQNSQNWTIETLEAHKFVCKPSMEMKFKAKL